MAITRELLAVRRSLEILLPDDEGVREIAFDGVVVGTLTRPKHAPKSNRGMFLRLDGVVWQNSPGARQTADSGMFDATFVTSLKQAMERLEKHYVDKAKALADK